MTQTIEYRTVDKARWGAGPWQAEPDKKQWQDADTGLPCLAVRHPALGHWCGYVGVPPGHPWHGKDYDSLSNVLVHGGLTFSDECAHGAEESGSVCHIPDPGEPDTVWWLGFDCAHFGDASPGYTGYERLIMSGTYRDLAYVERECADLAEEVASAGR